MRPFPRSCSILYIVSAASDCPGLLLVSSGFWSHAANTLLCGVGQISHLALGLRYKKERVGLQQQF